MSNETGSTNATNNENGIHAPPVDADGDGAELEVSDLRAGRPADGARRRPAFVTAVAFVAGALARRLTPTRRRMLGGALAIIGIALVVTLALRGYSATSLGAPSATGDLSSPANSTVYFEDGAPWGALRVNGQGADTELLQAEQAPLFLNPGATRIDYSAPPYAPLHCVISDPPASSDTCPLNTTYAPQDPVHSASDGRVINLRATLSRLSSAQFAALEQATENALASLATNGEPGTFYSSIQLGPGDHYLNAQGQVSVATQPLRATLQFVFDRASPVTTFPANNLPCRVFCTFDANGDLQAPATPEWVYTPIGVGAHTSVARGPFLQGSGLNNPGYGDVFLQIDVRWDGAWRVSIESYDLLAASSGLCDDGSLALQAILGDQSQSDIQGQGVGDAEGCVYSFQPQNTPTPTGTAAALFFFRCGVLLAVNAAARQLAPSLPIASPAETQAALAMAGQTYTSGR